MKKFASLFAVLAIVSCQQEAPTSLEKLRSERDSLNNLTNEIQTRLIELDGLIAQQDSTMSFTTVTLHDVESMAFSHYFQVYGSVEADRNVTLHSESAGKIERIFVREGQSVSAGERLIQLDDEIILNNIEEAETAVELAKTLYEKQSRLWDQNIGSEVQYLEAKNRFESAESRLATLRSQLAQSNLTAPFSGVVDEIFPKTGEYASPGAPLIRLLNLSQVYVTADVPESYINKVNTGAEVTLFFTSLGDTVTGKVIQVGQFINPDNRTFRLKIGVEGDANTYKPNMMASVRIRDYHADTSLVLPNHLIQQNQEGASYVYVFNASEGDLGTVERRYIHLGPSYNGQTEVRMGLTSEDLVVDKGARSIQNGARVRRVQ